VANGWTLSYEFLFYALFTFGLLFSRGLGSLLVVLILSALAIFGFLQPQNSIWGEFLSNQLLLEFAVGIGLGYYFSHIQRLPIIIMPILIGIGIGALLAVNQGIQSGIRVIDFGVPMLLIMMAGLGLEKELRKRPNQLLNLLGDSSYAMYLIHPFILVAGAMVLSKLGLTGVLGGWLFVLVLFVGSIVAGWVLFSCVETPIAKYIKKRSIRSLTKPHQGNVVRAVDS
jgi:peptidoglycan/LPS O-acetylase OafA/YrhL